jgi:hypothetical protein
MHGGCYRRKFVLLKWITLYAIFFKKKVYGDIGSWIGSSSFLLYLSHRTFPAPPLDNPVLPNSATGEGASLPLRWRGLENPKKFHPGRSYPGLISPMLPKGA